MSRQAQNVLTGVVACMVALIAVITVALSLRDGSGQSTATADPLGNGLTEAAGTESDQVGQDAGAQSSLGAAPTSPAPLAVLDDDGQAMTDAGVTPTAPPTTVTVAPTTAAVATTVAATPATEAPTTSAPAESSTTADTSAESTTTSEGTDSSGDTTTTTDASGSSSTQQDDTSTTSTTSGSTSTTAADAPPSGSMNAVELEIARLTNELRTNPNGPLKREGPAIDCGGRVGVDLSTGQYEAIGSLTVSETASLQVARPWSAQMTRDNFEHQPNAGVAALQAAGISVRSAGENIAYHNYPDKAMFHFTGWRESDGHFCNIMNPGFTHIGVGEVTKSDGISYATQNFYSTR